MNQCLIWVDFRRLQFLKKKLSKIDITDFPEQIYSWIHNFVNEKNRNFITIIVIWGKVLKNLRILWGILQFGVIDTNLVCLLIPLNPLIKCHYCWLYPYHDMLLSYRNQSINLHCKSIDWFLYVGNINLIYAKMWKSSAEMFHMLVQWLAKAFEFCFSKQMKYFTQKILF